MATRAREHHKTDAEHETEAVEITHRELIELRVWRVARGREDGAPDDGAKSEAHGHITKCHRRFKRRVRRVT